MAARRAIAKLSTSVVQRSLGLQETTRWPLLRLLDDVRRKKKFYSSVPQPQTERVRLTFIMRDGQRQDIRAKVGKSLLDNILENHVDIDGFGACESTLACSTCHLIFKKEDLEKLPNKPTEEEYDMLDLAFEVQDTSRLGCQVIVTKDMDGLEIIVPKGVSDVRGDKS